MNKTLIALTIVGLFTASVTHAAVTFVEAGKKWGEVKTIAQTTNVYRLYDAENGVVCYFAYMAGKDNVQPTQDCVKVK